MSIKDLGDSSCAKGVVPCGKVATEPSGKPTRLLKRIPQFVPGADGSAAEVHYQRLASLNAQPGHEPMVRPALPTLSAYWGTPDGQRAGRIVRCE